VDTLDDSTAGAAHRPWGGRSEKCKVWLVSGSEFVDKGGQTAL